MRRKPLLAVNHASTSKSTYTQKMGMISSNCYSFQNENFLNLSENCMKIIIIRESVGCY